MDRRDSLRWMLAALAAASALPAGATAIRRTPRGAGVGTDPDLLESYQGRTLWPLSFDAHQRRTAGALCGLIIPADERSPSAAQLEVHQFIDEWISAPYPEHAKDRRRITEGLAWLDAESARRHGQPFADADEAQQRAVCDDICWTARARPPFQEPAEFFARFRDLTATGFYTTAEGTRDVRFAGNTPSATFDGPPAAVLTLVGVS